MEIKLIVLAIALVLITCFIIYGYKFGAKKGQLWMEYPQAGTFVGVATQNVASKIVDGDAVPRSWFQKLWLKIGIYWIGFFSKILEFPWEVRSVKLEGSIFKGVEEPVLNKHQTYLPKSFPIAGLNSFAVHDGIATLIFNLHCSVADGKAALVIRKSRTVPQWQEMILTMIYSTTENFIKKLGIEEITALDIASTDPGTLKASLLNLNANLEIIYGIKFDAIDIKFDQEANALLTEAANRVAAAKFAADEKVEVAEGERRATETKKLTAILQLEITKLENEGKAHLVEQLMTKLGKSYDKYLLAEAIKGTSAHTLVLQADKAVVPISTT